MTQQLLTISMITNETAMVLENELCFADAVTREYDDEFEKTGAKIGNTVNVRKPGRFIGVSGAPLGVEDFYESSVPVVLGVPASYGDQFHVDVQFNTQDLLLSMDNYSKRVIKPAVAAIANRIDLVGLTMAKNATGNIVGTAGTTANALSTFLNAAAYLDSEAAPRDGDRSLLLDQWTNAAVIDNLKGLFTPSSKIGEQYTKGLMGRDAAGMNWRLDQNIVSHTFTSWATTVGTLTMNGANQGLATGWASTSSLLVTSNQTINWNTGDTFTIAGVYAVNPQSRKSYGKLRSFSVVTGYSGTGAQTLVVTPALIYGGQFQNVTTTPATNAVITPFSIAGTTATAVTSPQSILCHKNAFTLAMADLPLPRGVAFAGRGSDKDSGISVRVVSQYTINNDSEPCRFDVLFGWAPIYPELACRIAS